MDEPQKWCPRCETWKSLAEFSRDRATKDGYRGRCKSCDRDNGRRYRANPEVQQRATERMRQWTKENRERHRATNRRTFERNRQRQRDYGKKWYDKVGTQTKRRYRVENRERFRRYYAMRRARQRGLPRQQIDRAAIIERDGGHCYLCGCYPAKNMLVLDHVVPLARGGPHLPENLRVACSRCNNRKATYLLSELDWYSPR